MNTRLPLAFVLALLLWSLPAPAADLYYLTHEIPIGGSGAWDSLSLDPAGRRLYLAHSTRVVVVDIDKEEYLGVITGTPGVHGFATAPDLQRGFASNGRDATVSIVDLKTLKTLSKSTVGDDPDAILYEPAGKEVYVFNAAGHSVTVLAAATGAVAATIPLPGKPAGAVADPGAGRVYCNIEDKNEVAALDVKTHAVAGVWPVAPGKEPVSLALDPNRHRLFIGCRNERLAMVDAASGKIFDTIAIGRGADACAFDPSTHLVFNSAADGVTTVIRTDGDKLSAAQKLTVPGARAVAVDPRTHKLYLATASYEAPASDDATRRGRMIPNTLKIEVYSMGQDAP